MSEDSIHELYMRRCLELAVLAKANVGSNPMVGAVLVYQNRIIGEGYHQKYGAAHAEVNCFNSVKEKDQPLISQSTLYVSLEPCAHYGKTAPCAERIIREKVKKVVIAMCDPFEKVSGKGISLLEEAGIEVVLGVLEQEAQFLNRRFIHFVTHKSPYVILKWAETATGQFAPLSRQRTQLSNVYSKFLNQVWRSEEMAIMVGTTTAIMDNPSLLCTINSATQPLRIVLDRNLTIPKSHQLLADHAKTWIINEKIDNQVDNKRYIKLNFKQNLLSELLSLLYQYGISSLIVEGGVQLLQSFIQENLWQEARIIHCALTLNEATLDAPKIDTKLLIHSEPLVGDCIQYFLHQ